MIGISCQIKRPELLGKRKFETACKTGFTAMGAVWHRDILPKHFEPGAGRKYGYRPRSRKYRDRKVKLAQRGKAKKGGVVDLVLSGFMEQVMEQSATIRAFPTRATVNVQAPGYMTVRPRSSNAPNKFAELSALTSSDSKLLEGVLQKTTEAEIKKAIR